MKTLTTQQQQSISGGSHIPRSQASLAAPADNSQITDDGLSAFEKRHDHYQQPGFPTTWPSPSAI